MKRVTSGQGLFVPIVFLVCLLGWQGVQRIKPPDGPPTSFASVVPGQPLDDIILSSPFMKNRAGVRKFSEVFGERCGIAFFFVGTCAACRTYAPGWTGRSEVVAGSARVPIAWIGLGIDTAAITFYEEYGLEGPLYLAPTMDHWAKVGVRRTPTLYLLRGDTLLDELPPLPESIGVEQLQDCAAPADSDLVVRPHDAQRTILAR